MAPDPGAGVTVPWPVRGVTADPPDPVLIPPLAPGDADAVGFGAACGEWFGARVMPMMTSSAASRAAAPTAAEVTIVDLLCQDRWPLAGEAFDFASAPLGAPLLGGETPKPAACAAELAEDR